MDTKCVKAKHREDNLLEMHSFVHKYLLSSYLGLDTKKAIRVHLLTSKNPYLHKTYILVKRDTDNEQNKIFKCCILEVR